MTITTVPMFILVLSLSLLLFFFLSIVCVWFAYVVYLAAQALSLQPEGECEKQLTRPECCVFIAEIKEGRDD